MELVLILVVALLVLGPKRMPELARTLGRGLGEFRRASSELRQSLALDDLQNELRDGLSTRNTIKRPGEDRPAQAGDDLDPGAADQSAGEVSSETSDAEQVTSQTPPPVSAEAPHPGELPLGNDEAHHDVEESGDEESGIDGGPQAADSSLGNIPVGRSATQARRADTTDDERG